MNKRKRPGIGLIIILILAACLTPVFIEQQQILNVKSGELKNIKQKIGEENTHKVELQRQKAAINTDEYIEKVAREKFGMVKPGEKVFVDTNK